MSRIVGIDLGTTNSLIATMDAGIPYVIADAEGSRLTPSVVHFPDENTDPVIGMAAKRMRIVHPQTTIYSIKRFMGRRGSEIPQEEMLMTYPVRGEGAGPVYVPIGNSKIFPEDVSSLILRKLKQDAEQILGETVSRAVITVPAYFNDAQRNATKKAGELAGFTVERIINEPTAAALAYGLNRLKEKSKIAVYDLGGGTFDLSILELNHGTFEVLATNGNTRLGGDDLDRRLVDFLLTQIRQKGGPDLSSNLTALSRIREEAEQAKITLSSESETKISLPFLTNTFSFEYVLTQGELELLTRDIIEKTRAHCLRSIADSKLSPAQIDQVILVGGQTRMPLVRQLVEEIFGKAPSTSCNPDEAVALGAAVQAEILSGKIQNVLLLDVTPLSLGIETFGGLMNVIIPRNSTIPTKQGEMFTTAVNNQRSMKIHVLQGERERAKDNWSLGEFAIEFEPAPKAIPRVGVQFEIDANGILHVLARDIKSGNQKVVEMKSVVDVNDVEVERMVAESVEHAWEDLHARLWVEAKLKSNEMIPATRHALAEVGGQIGESYRVEIENVIREVEQAMATENPETKTGDPKILKAANEKLDSITQNLAELMIEKALGAALERRGLT